MVGIVTGRDRQPVRAITTPEYADGLLVLARRWVVAVARRQLSVPEGRVEGEQGVEHGAGDRGVTPGCSRGKSVDDTTVGTGADLNRARLGLSAIPGLSPGAGAVGVAG